jgi:hypothetical protein
LDRLRAAAAAELTHQEVKPIQSDFHFFAKENAHKYRSLAEEEVRKTLKLDEKPDPLLVNTNLNTRLKMAWENLTNDERDAFMIKEEEDRRRFMEEDEIASRHCATLTARGKSPRTTEKAEKFTVTSKSEEREDTEAIPHTSASAEDTSDSKNNSLNGKREHDKVLTDTNSDVDENGESLTDESPTNRPTPPSENSQGQFESPTKRNRQSQDT